MPDFDIVASGESASLGAALAARHPMARLALLDPVPDEEAGEMARRMVDVTARLDGTHLLSAWHQLRDRLLWRPWYRPDPTHAIPVGHKPDVARLHAVMTDWMRGGTEARETLAALAADRWTEGLAGIAPRTTLVLAPGHPWSQAGSARAALPETAVRTIPETREARADAVLQALVR